MALDGALLAKARQQLEEIKQNNDAEQQRRANRVYAKSALVRSIDGELRSLYPRVMKAALSDRMSAQKILAEVDARSQELLAQRAEELTRLGLPIDYLDEIYSCPKCQDRGVDDSGKICSCLMELYDRQQAKELSALPGFGSSEFEGFNLNYYSTQPDSDGISPRECMSIVLEFCREYAATFGDGSPNLLFRGSTGLGKTYLSACIAGAVAKKGASVVYETASAAFEAFENHKFSRNPEGEYEAKVKRILSCDLFILDDLGTEMTTSFTQSALYTIVNERLTKGKKTIISTNLTPAELTSRYTAQIMSRIMGEFEELGFRGGDIRAILKQQRYI